MGRGSRSSFATSMRAGIVTVTLNPSLDEWIQLPAIRLGQLNRAASFLRYPGGKGLNVSRVLQELGGRTLAFGLAGGEDGEILRQLMSRLRLAWTFVPVAGSTRNNYKILTASPSTLTEINTAGPRIRRAEWEALFTRIRRAAVRCDGVVLSGSLPPGAPQTLYGRWIRALHRLNVPTILDTSGKALAHGIRARPWLVKPNREETEALIGHRLMHRYHVVEAAQHVLQRGATLAILSLGGDGAVLAAQHPRGVWWARPPRVRVVSAVGAGDSLVGGFLFAWTRRYGLLESFRWGVAAGTAAVMTPGTALCRQADVVRLQRRIVIDRLV